MANLIAYTRVSSENQRDNTSLEQQLQRIAGYCSMTGHAIVQHCQDVETASGKRPRKGLDEALRVIEEGGADGLICTALDRFARSTVEGLRVARELRERQKQLVVLDLQLDTSTAIGGCIFTVLLAFAQLERETIQERTRAGYKAKVSKGGYGCGHPPYGWDAVGKTLVANPVEQVWRQRIFEWHRQGISDRQIAKRLNEAGVPTKRGKLWHCGTVYYLLSKQPKFARDNDERAS